MIFIVKRQTSFFVSFETGGYDKKKREDAE
jgi:hypothetical protein